MDPLAGALQAEAFVDQHGQAQGLEGGGHVGAVVVAQHRAGPVARSDAGYEVPHPGQDLLVGARDAETVVAGQHAEVGLDLVDQGPGRRRGLGQGVHVQIGELEDREAVEGGRQRLEGQLEPGQPKVERVAQAAPVEADQAQPDAEDRDQHLEQRPIAPARTAVRRTPLLADLHFGPPPVPALPGA